VWRYMNIEIQDQKRKAYCFTSMKERIIINQIKHVHREYYLYTVDASGTFQYQQRMW